MDCSGTRGIGGECNCIFRYIRIKITNFVFFLIGIEPVSYAAESCTLVGIFHFKVDCISYHFIIFGKYIDFYTACTGDKICGGAQIESGMGHSNYGLIRCAGRQCYVVGCLSGVKVRNPVYSIYSFDLVRQGGRSGGVRSNVIAQLHPLRSYSKMCGDLYPITGIVLLLG